MTWSKLLHDPADFLWTALNTRGVRLTFYVLLVAGLFPAARFILAVVLLVTLAFMWTRDYLRTGSRKVLSPCSGFRPGGRRLRMHVC